MNTKTEAKKNILEVEYPEQISDKNSLFTFAFHALRKLISTSDDFSGNLRPLGDVQVISTTEAMRWIGIENMANFRHHMGQYEKKYNKKIRVIGYQSEGTPKTEDSPGTPPRGPIYLKEDLVDFRHYVLGKTGRLDFEEFQK